MYLERDSYDSVMWDSLALQDLQKMACDERDEIKKCFANMPDTHKTIKEDGREVIVIDDENEDESSDDDTVMEDVDDDTLNDDSNEEDNFVKEELAKESKKIIFNSATIPLMQIFFLK